MNDRHHQQLVTRARQRIAHGDLHHACELLQECLAGDPDHAEAHALLALCLLDLRLLGPAQAEAEAALLCDPQEALAHSAMGSVCLGDRRFTRASEHYERALQLDPSDSYHHLRVAHLAAVLDQPRQHLLERALQLDPDDPDVLAALAEERLDHRDLEAAHTFALRALEADPESHDALLAMARVLLHRDDVPGAREHVVMALRQHANSEEGLRLLVAIKARQNPFLGLWFRWSLWMDAASNGRSVALLVGGFLAFQLLSALAEDLGYPSVADVLHYAWLGIVAYSWIAPGVFARMLAHELRGVELDERY